MFRILSTITLLFFWVQTSTAQLLTNLQETDAVEGAISPFSFMDDLVFVGKTLYFAGGEMGLTTLDENGKFSAPTEFGQNSTVLTQDTYQIATNGTHLYITDFNANLVVFDLADPQNPVEGTALTLKGGAIEMDVRDQVLITLPNFNTADWALELFDLSAPATPLKQGEYAPTLGKATYLDLPPNPLHPHVLFLTVQNAADPNEESGVLELINISDPQNPAFLSNIATMGLPTRVRVYGYTAYVASHNSDQSTWFLEVFDISDPQNPERITNLSWTDDFLFDLRVTSTGLLVGSFSLSGYRVYAFDGTRLRQHTFLAEAEDQQFFFGPSTMALHEPDASTKAPTENNHLYIASLNETNRSQGTGGFNDSAFKRNVYKFQKSYGCAKPQVPYYKPPKTRSGNTTTMTTKKGTYEIFVYGGDQGGIDGAAPKNTGVSTDLWGFDGERWILLDAGPGAIKPPARRNHSATFMNGKLYVFGGRNANDELLNDLWAYTPPEAGKTQGTWDLISQSLNQGPTPRENPTMGHSEGRLFIAGGENAASTFQDFWVHHNMTWTRKNDMPQPLTQTGFNNYGTLQFFFDCQKKDAADTTCQIYTRDVVTDTWDLVQANGLVPSVRTQSATISYGNIMGMVGGVDSDGKVLDETVSYNIANNTWEEHPLCPMNDNEGTLTNDMPPSEGDGFQGGTLALFFKNNAVKRAGEFDVLLYGGQGGEGSGTNAIRTLTWPAQTTNFAPEAEAPPADLDLVAGGEAATVDVTNLFSDADGQALTLSVMSADPAIATAELVGTTLTITPLAVGEATIRVLADDGNGAVGVVAFTARVPTGVALSPADVPATFALHQNYPNPFNPSTQLGYELAETSNVTINIYNAMGQRVAQVVQTQQAAGRYQATWDARNMASGLYMARMTVHTASGTRLEKTRTMMLLR